ncbi:hypothetical protein EDD18DRAFT_1111674 [Armillaria luteobubalina]|uniref:Uncharacterized protein n=1 Tax=Armillaria luteobubalina TaxID=153913 RepID=A0AA39PHE2_9AGAR|nr:hypothetical protein EDD18DRAFT_1111674 [Armillaria luteobubalina]
MSAPTKGRKPAPARKGIIKGVSPTAALIILKEHDTTISNSKSKQKTLDANLSRKKSILQDQSNSSKRTHVSAPDSPGAARAKKMNRKGSKEDIAGIHRTETSMPKPALKKVKQPLPAYDEYSSDDALPPPMPIKKVAPAAETIVIDSEPEENPFASISKTPIDDAGEGSSKKDVKGKSKEIPLPPKKKTTEKKPKKQSEEFINGTSGPEVAQHMSGNRIRLPSGFASNPKATVYYTAVSAGSVTAISHAALHSLHIQLLSLQDSMRRTAMEEERLNMDLVAAGRPSMHFPDFLPDHLNDLSGTLRLLEHFHREESTQYMSNATLSLFTVIRDAAKDKKTFQVPIVVPMPHPLEDHGEGSSTGPGTASHSGGDDGDGDEEDGHNGSDGCEEDGNQYADLYDEDDEECRNVSYARDLAIGSSLWTITMDVLTELETTLSTFSPPPSISPSILRPKYQSIISTAQGLLVKVEDIPVKQENIPVCAYIPRSPENRVNEILSYLRDPYITLQEFCTFIQVDRLPKYERREQEFLIRLVRGYRPASVLSVKQALPYELRPLSNVWSRACDCLVRAKSLADPISRLSQIDRQLINLDQGAPFTRLIDYVLYTAARLQFAIEYNSLRAQDRKGYSDNIFNLCKRRDIDRLRGHPAGITSLKQTFKTRHRKDVTSRNHLLNLYRLFGVSVLLDPSLEMRTKTGAPTCSNTYVATIDLLQQRLVPFTPALDALDDQNRTPSVYNFVKNFVETFDQN